MELPFREEGDELLKPGVVTALRGRLREHARHQDLRTVAAYAFDRRTRMLPFFFVDKRMSGAGLRAVGGALHEAGFDKTRVVLQTRNPNFKPSRMKIDGGLPDLFMTSNMLIHSAPMKRMLQDVCRIDPADRPLVIAGGPHMWYMPWDAFSADEADPHRADLAVTGELPVFLEFMDVLLTERAHGEPLRQAFLRAKAAGAFDHVPGLVYPVGEDGRVPEALVDTGIQRLLGDLDELPDPSHGFRVLERPSRKETLGARPLEKDKVGKYTPIATVEMTYGCKFRCPYCPIPALNQHKDRQKSPARIAHEMKSLYEEFGIRYFFGSDDNFFNRRERAVSIVEELAKTTVDGGTRLGKRVTWGTEVTVHDTLVMRDHLRTARDGGCKALWLGVEDMTASFIKKGQSVDKTREAFNLLWRNGIHPMPMLMHDDSQPLISFKSARGLINQLQLLRNAHAMSAQVLVYAPAPGTKSMSEYETGMVYDSVNGRPVEPYMTDGNHVTGSRHKRPWTRQINLIAAYMFFYNPLRLLKALVLPKNRRGHFADAGAQVMGMAGWIQNLIKTPRWFYHLLRGRIVRHTAAPVSPIPFRSVGGGPAPHGLPGQPLRADDAEKRHLVGTP